jgi:hypothetical protein
MIIIHPTYNSIFYIIIIKLLVLNKYNLDGGDYI